MNLLHHPSKPVPLPLREAHLLEEFLFPLTAAGVAGRSRRAGVHNCSSYEQFQKYFEGACCHICIGNGNASCIKVIYGRLGGEWYLRLEDRRLTTMLLPGLPQSACLGDDCGLSTRGARAGSTEGAPGPGSAPPGPGSAPAASGFPASVYS